MMERGKACAGKVACVRARVFHRTWAMLLVNMKSRLHTCPPAPNHQTHVQSS